MNLVCVVKLVVVGLSLTTNPKKLKSLNLQGFLPKVETPGGFSSSKAAQPENLPVPMTETDSKDPMSVSDVNALVSAQTRADSVLACAKLFSLKCFVCLPI